MIWRISERRAFQELARTGRRARTETLWCRFVFDPAATPLRVAFAVDRSVGSATRRNRLRRRLRALVIGAATRGQVDRGWLLIGTTPAAAEQTFESLGREVDDLLRRVRPSPPVPA